MLSRTIHPQPFSDNEDKHSPATTRGFQMCRLYSQKRWHRVQHLANEFWNHWKQDYLQSLQQCPKWNCTRPNVQTNNIVLLKDDNLLHNQWQLARVVEAEPDADGLVQKVKVAVADRNLTKSG